MDRHEFINELRARLRRLPQDEIENAVSYYEEYFDEAGPANESRTVEALGAPAIVASKIIGEFAVKPAPPRNGKKLPNAFIIAILAVFAPPVALPIAVGIFAIALSLGAAFFALIIAGWAVALAGAVCAAAGLWAFAGSAADGMFYFGAGLLLLALGAAAATALAKSGRAAFRSLQEWIGQILIKRGERRLI